MIHTPTSADTYMVYIKYLYTYIVFCLFFFQSETSLKQTDSVPHRGYNNIIIISYWPMLMTHSGAREQCFLHANLSVTQLIRSCGFLEMPILCVKTCAAELACADRCCCTVHNITLCRMCVSSRADRLHARPDTVFRNISHSWIYDTRLFIYFFFSFFFLLYSSNNKIYVVRYSIRCRKHYNNGNRLLPIITAATTAIVVAGLIMLMFCSY